VRLSYAALLPTGSHRVFGEETVSLHKLRAVLGFGVAVLVAVSGLVVAGPTPRAEAAIASEFDPGFIISDQRFFDSGSMTEGQIQDFLNSKVSACRAGYVCLKDYRMSTFSRAAVEPGHCAAYAGVANERASSIIYKTAVACGINPQTLLVLLQKETGLVTGTAPTDGTYRKAMGYGCPDTSSCDAAFYGFYNQVYKSAWQFRQYSNYPDRRYKIGSTSVGFHPNAACGASTVNIRNQATANLYNYTPYQPNAAAMANLSGTGDACSSYGNRNFWKFFSDWFGSPTGVTNPIGNVEQISASPGKVRVSGWTLDPDFANAIDVHVYIGAYGFARTADAIRQDVGAAYPAFGSKHGFDLTLDAPTTGNVDVCVFAINVGGGVNSRLGCKTLFVAGGSPIGNVESVTTEPGAILVSGWAFDPDTNASGTVHVYVDGVGTSYNANKSRPDVARVYPGYGELHGFEEKIQASVGSHSVCTYAINTGAGSHVLMGCRTVVVQPPAPVISEQGRSPFGNFEAAETDAGTVTVSGWGLDPDTTASIPVHIYVDGVGTAYKTAVSRADVGRAYPGYGNLHGFSQTIALKPGQHDICVFAINTGPGPHTLLGCRSASIPIPEVVISESGRSPEGNLELVSTVPGGIKVEGWAIDPDSAASTAVHVYVDGVGTSYPADKKRADVGSAYPGYGDQHGFVESVTAAPGVHNVCVYAINTGPGPHTLLRCQDVIV